MRAVRYYGKEDVRVERVPDPELLNPRDAIVKITATAICGSDLHGSSPSIAFRSGWRSLSPTAARRYSTTRGPMCWMHYAR